MASLGAIDSARRILVAHGTRSARGVELVRRIADAVAARTGPLDVAFVDVLGPSPSELLIEDSRPTILVPAFLAAGYHVHTDVPQHIEHSGHVAAAVTAPLGPDPMLARALLRRLTEAGWRSGDTVVLGATGSSSENARGDVRVMAGYLSTLVGAEVEVGFLAAGEPTVEQTVAKARKPGRRVAIAAYQLADGLFHTKLHDVGADLVAAPLGMAPEVIDVLVDRFETAQIR